MKYEFQKKLVLPVVVIIVVAVLVGRGIYFSIQDKRIDKLREQYVKELTTELKSIEEFDYVNGITTTVSCDVVNSGKSNAYFDNNIEAVVEFNEKYNKLSRQEQCLKLCDIDKKMADIINNVYRNSDFFEYFVENRINSYSKCIRYRGMELAVYSNHDFKYSCQGISYDIVDNVFGVNPFPHSNENEELFDYIYQDGRISHFQNWADKNIGSESSVTQNNNSSPKSQYDPYDVHSYKSAQDFADDKYEEFFDYEDEYEDEDEAYDAAEDYWNDNY